MRRALALLPCVAATDWTSISPLLTTFPDDHFPTVPARSSAQALFDGVLLGGGAPFATFTISSREDSATTRSNLGTRVDSRLIACNASVDDSSLVAGPSHLCTGAEAGTCSECICRGSGAGTNICMAGMRGESIQLKSKLGGSGWAPQSAFPSFIQLTFPAVPDGASSTTLRFTMDSSYRPQLYGGNPCPKASATYNCSLCIAGPWDHAMPAGLHLLWSAAGRTDYVITGPLTELMAAWDQAHASGDANMRTVVVESPPELALAPGDYPVATFFVFNQYLGYTEVERDDDGDYVTPWSSTSSNCNPKWSTPDPYPLEDRNTAFYFESATMVYRQELRLPDEPPLARPRTHGNESAWFASRVEPFLALPCEPAAQQNLGYFGKAGVWDAKGYWQKAAFDYSTCNGGSVTPWDDVADGNDAAARYLDTSGSLGQPRFRDGRRCLFLLRLLWRCADLNNGSYTTCSHSESQAQALAAAVVASDLEAFYTTPGAYKISGASAVSFDCGANPTNDGQCMFDLNTEVQVGYFSLWLDVLTSRPGLIAPANVTAVADGLRSRIGLFRNHFNTGDWRLWNGNNWTPRLCVGALAWVVAFWHEENAIAREVLRMINDLLWLHYPAFYLDDGTPVEGISYSYMSVEDAVELSELQRAAFGAVPQAIVASVSLLEGAIAFQLESMSGDGRMVDFGDSHALAGYSPRTLELAAMRRIVLGNESAPLAMGPCQARELCSGMYGSYGVYVDPWRISPALAPMSGELAPLAAACTAADPAQPLGGATEALFLDGGFASLRLPLMGGGDESTLPPCFAPNDGGTEPFCIEAELPSLADLIPYSKLAIQARPSSFIKSELDFGTLTWSAWGARLLSEFGYGTIASFSNGDDTRRQGFLDNNPAGHNTVIVREAFQSVANGNDEDEINFSQFNWVAGSMSVADVSRNEGGGGAARCLLLDGSAVYGALRPDGWLDVMRRYACPLVGDNVGSDGGAGFVVLDVLQVKASRAALTLDGDGSGGPTFTEGTAHSSLHIDEYFYTENSAALAQDEHGNKLAQELPWNTAENPRTSRCEHVDVTVVGAEAAAVLLRPRCGIGEDRDADGVGAVGGFAAAAGGGRFVVDGLVTAPDRWLTPNSYQKRRFRFVTDTPTDAGGDVRAFALVPAAAHNSSAMPVVRLSSCSDAVGCADLAGPEPSAEPEPSIPDGSPIGCSCVELCIGATLRWAVVVQARLVALHVVGICDEAASTRNSTLVHSARLAAIGPLPPSPPSPPHQPPPRHPPFAPLDAGVTVVAEVATVVELGLTIAGDLASFDKAQQAALKLTLADLLSCQEPSCFLELRVAAASVSVTAILTIPEAGGGATATAVETAATALVAQPVGTISASLGVSVEAAAPLAVTTGVTVPLAVAPPPPSLPPSLPQTDGPPSPLPLPSSDNLSITAITMALAAGGAGAVVLFACIYVLVARCRRRNPAALRWNPTAVSKAAGSVGSDTTGARIVSV